MPGLYALGAGTAAEWLRRSPRFLGGERWISGTIYIGLGSGRHRDEREPQVALDLAAALSR